MSLGEERDSAGICARGKEFGWECIRVGMTMLEEGHKGRLHGKMPDIGPVVNWLETQGYCTQIRILGTFWPVVSYS